MTSTTKQSIHEVFTYLRVRDAAEAMRFYATAFGAVEKFRLTEPSGASDTPRCNSGRPC